MLEGQGKGRQGAAGEYLTSEGNAIACVSKQGLKRHV